MAENKKNIDNNIDEMDELLMLDAEDDIEDETEPEAEFINEDSSVVLPDLHAYLKQIGEYKLMTPDEETALFSKMNSLPDG